MVNRLSREPAIGSEQTYPVGRKRIYGRVVLDSGGSGLSRDPAGPEMVYPVQEERVYGVVVSKPATPKEDNTRDT